MTGAFEDCARLPIARLEDLHVAVMGAGLAATQMLDGMLRGGLALATIVYGGGLQNVLISIESSAEIDPAGPS
jgi:hypothetical protein